MITLKSRYITKEDYLQYYKEDLDLLLNTHDGDNFICRIENDLHSFLNGRFGRDVDREFPTYSEFQKSQYKMALLEQAHYVFHNGDLLSDSAFDPDAGLRISKEKRIDLAISEKAKQYLMACGLWTRKLRGGTLGGTFYFGGFNGGSIL